MGQPTKAMLRRALEMSVDAIHATAWMVRSGEGGITRCRECRKPRDEHAPDCVVGMALMVAAAMGSSAEHDAQTEGK